jgi:predicted kinase
MGDQGQSVAISGNQVILSGNQGQSAAHLQPRETKLISELEARPQRALALSFSVLKVGHKVVTDAAVRGLLRRHRTRARLSATGAGAVAVAVAVAVAAEEGEAPAAPAAPAA